MHSLRHITSFFAEYKVCWSSDWHLVAQATHYKWIEAVSLVSFNAYWTSAEICWSLRSKFFSLPVPVPLVYFAFLHSEARAQFNHVLACPVGILLKFWLEDCDLITRKPEPSLLSPVTIIACLVLEDVWYYIVQVDWSFTIRHSNFELRSVKRFTLVYALFLRLTDSFADDRLYFEAAVALIARRIQLRLAWVCRIVGLGDCTHCTWTGLRYDGDWSVSHAEFFWICELLVEWFQLNWRIFTSCTGNDGPKFICFWRREVGAGWDLRFDRRRVVQNLVLQLDKTGKGGKSILLRRSWLERRELLYG